MSDGRSRKRLSGAAYRKAAQEKLEKNEAISKKIPKISTFFRKTEAGLESTDQSPSQVVVVEAGGSSDEHSKAESERPYVLDQETHQEIFDDDMRVDVQENLEIADDKFVYDPAVWPINEETREKVIQNGINQDFSKLDLSRSKRFVGGQHRYLTQSLFQSKLINGKEIKRSYLMYSGSSGKLFCIPCQLFGGISKLAKEGFDNWKHGQDHLQSHENSSDHKSCILVMKRRMTSAGRVDSQLLSQVEDEISYWRNVLKRVVAVVRSLAAAGLPLRGHFERFGTTHNCGNFIMCIELIAEFDPFLASHISKYGNPGQGHTSYLSSTTYEEFLKLMGKKVTDIIVEEIKAAKYFAIIVDSTPDISHVDQLAVIIRYVPEKGDAVERFLCFLPNTGHKSEELFHTVLAVLDKFGIEIENCRGQAYDNASNMSGIYSGLQARIKEKSATAVYTPCSAHSLNLVGEHSTSSCKESRDFFMLLNSLYTFFSASTKRWEVLTECLKKKSNLTLKSLSKTRWSAREDACKALNEDWDEVLEALRIIADDEREKATTRSEASGYLVKLQRLETAFLSILWGDLLPRFNISSKKLQSLETDLSTVSIIYSSLLEYVKSIKQEYDFDIYENGALAKSEAAVYEDEIKRTKIRKLLPGETREGEIHLSGRDNFRVNSYLVILDTLINELEKRKNSYDELNSLFGFLVKSVASPLSLKELNDHSTRLCNFYDKDLPGPEAFANEALHFFGFLNQFDENERPKTLQSMYQALCENDLQDVYPYIDITLRLFLSIPATNCSAERSFSVLKRIKDYSRSTMGEKRLRNVAVLTIEHDITKNVDFEDVIDSFSNSRSRRKQL